MYSLRNIFSFKFSLVCLVTIFYLSFMETSGLKGPSFFLFLGRFDLFAHFSMYFGLSLIFFFEKYRKSDKKAESLKFSKCQKFILLFIFISFLVEVFQPILSNRTRELSDFLANTCGSYTGFFCLRYFIKKIKFF
ncbi:MAG: VanZ family protein [Marinilabiliaceae bacterium]|nr:VanZ family protein [Marinilabiliaceae bacterium]